MSNLAGKAYALTVISPMRFTWLNRLIFAAVRLLPGALSTLHQMRIIHFARWVILPRDRWPGAPKGWRTRHGYMLFASNFNNTWDTYLDEFSDILARSLDLLWYQGVAFPRSVPSRPFKHYINHNTVDAGHYYNATPGHAVRDIHNAFHVRQAIDTLSRSLDALEADVTLSERDREQQFRERFHAVWRTLQNRLPTPGPAPAVAPDVQALNQARRARIARLEALKGHQGFHPRVRAGGSDHPTASHAEL